MTQDDKDMLFALLICFLAGVCIVLGFENWTNNFPRQGYFYVEAGDGYRESEPGNYACLTDDENRHSTRVTRWLSLDDAKKVCDGLNRVIVEAGAANK